MNRTKYFAAIAALLCISLFCFASCDLGDGDSTQIIIENTSTFAGLAGVGVGKYITEASVKSTDNGAVVYQSGNISVGPGEKCEIGVDQGKYQVKIEIKSKLLGQTLAGEDEMTVRCEVSNGDTVRLKYDGNNFE